MKMFFHYYMSLHAFNLPFSLFVAAAVVGLEINFFSIFFFSYVVVGLGLAFYFFWLRFPERYFFYQNRGWSKLSLMGGCFLLNFAFYLVYALSKLLLHGS